ncbi:MAG: DegV family protein [Clostridiales bacterium]|nr:DegV family protein [Clostridiales bacterium]
MATVRIISDSAADLSMEVYKKYDVSVVSFYITFDKVKYYKEHKDITAQEFFQRLRTEKAFPSTSLPTAEDYAQTFRPFLEAGQDIVCLCISSKFSGSYDSAKLAATELKEEFPGRVIRVIDSIQASAGEGVIVLEMVKMRDAGWDADAIAARTEVIKHSARVFLTVDSLEYLQKGGRVGKASALAGTILNIKPIITMVNEELHPTAKVRGRQNAIDRVIRMNDEYCGDRRADYNFLLLNSESMPEITAVEKRMIEMGYTFEYPIQSLGITIGSHIGPTVVGICPVLRWDAK